MDLDRLRFHAFGDLRLYCEKVASAVGLASLPIFGVALSQAEAFARNTGLALQLTNILRDLGADAKEGRMYLPLEDLDRFGVKEEEIRRGALTGEMMALLGFEAERAKAFYREAERSLPDGKKWPLFPPRLMAMIYRRLLEKIETDSFPVWGARPKLSVWSKLREVARCLWGV
jgi:phytoene synthase